MNAERNAKRVLRTAQGAVGVSVLVFAVAISRPGLGTMPAVVEGFAVPQSGRGFAGSEPVRLDVSRLLARDPFSPVRSAPEVAYRIESASEPSGIVSPPRAPVLLLGTVLRSAGRSFVMCQVGGEAAKVVYPGQAIGGLTLESVLQGSAVFTDESGARVTLRVARTGE